MKNLLISADRDAIISRLNVLGSKSNRRWGKMTVEQVFPHMADPFRVHLGEKKATQVKSPLYSSFLGHLVATVLPWPKSAFTAKEYLSPTGMTNPVSIDHDRQQLILLIHRFVNLNPQKSIPPSPVFGQLSLKQLGRLYWRHMDHHLKQFGH